MGFLDRLRRSGAVPDDLLERFLLVPTPDTGEEPRGFHVLEEDREMSFVLVHDEDGLPVLPAFTSKEALQRWNPEGSRYVGLQGRALVEILARSDWDRIVVDTTDRSAFAIPRSAALELLGVAAYTQPAGSRMLVGQPARTPPHGLVTAVQRACANEPTVAEAFLYQVAILEQGNTPHLAIGLRVDARVDEEDRVRIAHSIGRAVDPQSWGYDFVDLEVLEDDMLNAVRSGATAIFQRGRR